MWAPWDHGAATGSVSIRCLPPGLPAEALSRLHSPIGLDLGAVTPAEVAVSITAELVASRSRSAGASVLASSLKDGTGPIHTGPIHQRQHHATPGDPMDMNTIEAVVRTEDPAEWRDGDAWLAGGTVLFSYGSLAFGKEPLRRLLDLGDAGWPAVTVTETGIELAATCTVAELYALPASDVLGGAGSCLARPGPRPPLLRLLRGLLQGVEHVHRGRQPLHLAARRSHDFAVRRPRRRGHRARTGRCPPHRAGGRLRHGGRAGTAWRPANSCAASTSRRRPLPPGWRSAGCRSATWDGPGCC